jgi:hypothetical protein
VEPLPPNNPSINVVVGSPNPFRSDKRREFIKLVRRCVGAKRLRRFVCSLEDLEGLMDLFDEALSLSDPSRFRLDALDPRHPLRVAAEERVVFFHINTLNEEALGLRYGLEITHLICEGVYSLDIHGRYPLESKGAKLEPVYDYWLGKA